MKEAIERGHEVTAIARERSKVTAEVPVIEKDMAGFFGPEGTRTGSYQIG